MLNMTFLACHYAISIGEITASISLKKYIQFLSYQVKR